MHRAGESFRATVGISSGASLLPHEGPLGPARRPVTQTATALLIERAVFGLVVIVLRLPSATEQSYVRGFYLYADTDRDGRPYYLTFAGSGYSSMGGIFQLAILSHHSRIIFHFAEQKHHAVCDRGDAAAIAAGRVDDAQSLARGAFHKTHNHNRTACVG